MLGIIGRQGDHGDLIDILISIEQQWPKNSTLRKSRINSKMAVHTNTAIEF